MFLAQLTSGLQVVKQSSRAGQASQLESTRGADHSLIGPDGSEYQTSQQQQQQHVTDQLCSLSVCHGEPDLANTGCRAPKYHSYRQVMSYTFGMLCE